MMDYDVIQDGDSYLSLEVGEVLIVVDREDMEIRVWIDREKLGTIKLPAGVLDDSEEAE